jgi:hypothetical protein
MAKTNFFNRACFIELLSLDPTQFNSPWRSCTYRLCCLLHRMCQRLGRQARTFDWNRHILPRFKGRQAALNRPLRRGIQRFRLGTDEQYEEANLRSLGEYIHKSALLFRPECQPPAVLIPLSNYFADRNLSRLFIRISQASVDRPSSRRTTASVLVRAS